MSTPGAPASTVVRLGGGGGFWGDTPEGASELVHSGRIDYLVLDYLAEITMSILARMKAKNPALGYATDFVSHVMKPLAREIAARGVKVVANAGGVNLDACRDALQSALREEGVDLKIAIVRGDDLATKAAQFRANGVREMFRGEPLPEALASVNAYLGAFPIAAALYAGADIVLTGRCVDSALALGPLIHAFGWRASDYDLLAAGTLVGHLIECGAQVTGGILTDWRTVAGGWDHMGFPIAECCADGTFTITKPEGTGGRVSVMSVGEQMTYEVGDPGAYIVPDAVCDWRNVHLETIGEDCVRVSGARGRPPTRTYKVSATYSDGYRAAVTMMIAGREAADKARAVGEAILARTERMMREAGFVGFAERSIEVIGAEFSFGAQSRAACAREVVLKIGVRHPQRAALDIFAREIYPAASAMAQGLTGFAGGRPEPQPVVRLFSFLVDRNEAPASVEIDGRVIAIADHIPNVAESPAEPIPVAARATAVGPAVRVPLIALAYGRSGDKGDTANISVIARRAEFVDAIRAGVTAEAVGAYMAHFVDGKVERYEWPGLMAFNFLLHGALGGGGIASLRHDPQGKAFAQILLDMEVDVPADWLRPGGLLEGWRDPLNKEQVA